MLKFPEPEEDRDRERVGRDRDAHLLEDRGERLGREGAEARDGEEEPDHRHGERDHRRAVADVLRDLPLAHGGGAEADRPVRAEERQHRDFPFIQRRETIEEAREPRCHGERHEHHVDDEERRPHLRGSTKCPHEKPPVSRGDTPTAGKKTYSNIPVRC